MCLLDSQNGDWVDGHQSDGGLDFASDDLEGVVSKLSAAGFAPYLTTIGGSGLGLRNCSESEGAISDEFSCKASEELVQWVESGQGWIYV